MKIRNGSFTLLKWQFHLIIQYIIRIHLEESREDRNGPNFSSPPTWPFFSFWHYQLSFTLIPTMEFFGDNGNVLYACIVQYGSLKPHVLLSIWHVISVTEKPNFPFYLILTNLNSHMYLLATVADNRVLEFLSLFQREYVCLFVLLHLCSFSVSLKVSPCWFAVHKWCCQNVYLYLLLLLLSSSSSL